METEPRRLNIDDRQCPLLQLSRRLGYKRASGVFLPEVHAWFLQEFGPTNFPPLCPRVIEVFDQAESFAVEGVAEKIRVRTRDGLAHPHHRREAILVRDERARERLGVLGGS